MKNKSFKEIANDILLLIEKEIYETEQWFIMAIERGEITEDVRDIIRLEVRGVLGAINNYFSYPLLEERIRKLKKKKID
jgi:hypothetical protein